MRKLLILNFSARQSDSLTREFAAAFAADWSQAGPDRQVHELDLGANPPSALGAEHLEAVCTDPAARTGAQVALLAEGSHYIQTLQEADVVLLASPIYNFGMPASLKAWIDQVVRRGESYRYDETLENPFVGLIADKPVVLVIAAGNREFHPGGALESMNFLEPHVRAVLGFLGMQTVHAIHTGGHESHPDTWRKLADSERSALCALARQL